MVLSPLQATEVACPSAWRLAVREMTMMEWLRSSLSDCVRVDSNATLVPADSETNFQKLSQSDSRDSKRYQNADQLDFSSRTRSEPGAAAFLDAGRTRPSARSIRGVGHGARRAVGLPGGVRRREYPSTTDITAWKTSGYMLLCSHAEPSTRTLRKGTGTPTSQSDTLYKCSAAACSTRRTTAARQAVHGVKNLCEHMDASAFDGARSEDDLGGWAGEDTCTVTDMVDRNLKSDTGGVLCWNDANTRRPRRTIGWCVDDNVKPMSVGVGSSTNGYLGDVGYRDIQRLVPWSRILVALVTSGIDAVVLQPASVGRAGAGTSHSAGARPRAARRQRPTSRPTATPACAGPRATPSKDLYVTGITLADRRSARPCTRRRSPIRDAVAAYRRRARSPGTSS